MRQRKLLCLLIVLCQSSFIIAGVPVSVPDQKDFKSTTSRTDFGSYAIDYGSDANAVSVFVQTKIANLQNKNAGLVLTYSKTSPGGYHYTFRQTYMGVPVFSSDMMVNVSRQNVVYSIFDDSYDVSQWRVNMTAFDYQQVGAFTSYVKAYFQADVTQSAKQVITYYEKTNTPELSYEVNLRSKDGHQRNVIVARDRILYERDACMYRAAAPDSLVSGMVFRPDPLTTAHKRYYDSYIGHDSAYQDFGNRDTPALNLQRVSRTFTAEFQDSIFYLRNQYVRLEAVGSDLIDPVTSRTPTFNYTRSQNGFIDVMLYYHINVIRQYIHDLGFDMGDTLVVPDSHAVSADNSFFAQPVNIYYGTGGVPDCQDADVIVHEYTHFLSWNANRSNGAGASSQRQSIDEGGCDYNASSYSASIDTFGWERMFTWDGHNEYWRGRFVNDATVYPGIPNTAGLSGIYKYSVIWSSALMQVWFDIGRGPADSLFFESMYGLASNITLLDAAQQYIKADSVLFGGKYHCAIVRDFRDHGLAKDAACGVYPLGITPVEDRQELFKFTSYPDGFKVEPYVVNANMDINLYDIAGQKLATYHNVATEIRPDHLPAGIYIVDVSVSGQHKGYKWAKY